MSIKEKILKTVFPHGSIVKIRFGPMKGLKYEINNTSRWAPIFGRWEPYLQYIFSSLIKRGQTIYDLGANYGLHSMLFSKLAGNSGKIYSFEPLERNIKLIKKNMQLNNIQNIFPIQFAVSYYNGSSNFKLGVHDTQGSIQGIGSESGDIVEVKTITLDKFISNGNPHPDIIKIDIEGEESNALIGFEKNIDQCKPIIIVELHTPEQDKKVGSFFKKHGYWVYRITKRNYDTNVPVKYLVKVDDLNLPWPHKNGIWGTVLSFHPDRPLF